MRHQHRQQWPAVAAVPLKAMRLRDLRLLLSLLGIAFVGLTAWSLRYFSRYQPLTSLAQSYVQPGLGQIALQATDVLVVAHEGGRRRWRVSARTLTFSRDRRTVSVDGIKQGLLYDAQGRPEASLTAGHAVYQTTFGPISDSALGILRMDTQIRAVLLNASHPVLQSQALVWNSLNNHLSSPGPLTAALPHLSVTAGNATYDLPPIGTAVTARGTLHLGGGIRAIVHSTRGLTTVTCPGLTWDAAKNLAQSLGPVNAQIPGGWGTATAAAISVDTRQGNLTGQGFQGTLRLPREVQ
ncbi:MAG: hypothetical protein M3Y13_03105 [Armatimonadota bacterium]|nr:hypothetical protein [Armatimonadota bacterium]